MSIEHGSKILQSDMAAFAALPNYYVQKYKKNPFNSLHEPLVWQPLVNWPLDSIIIDYYGNAHKCVAIGAGTVSLGTSGMVHPFAATGNVGDFTYDGYDRWEYGVDDYDNIGPKIKWERIDISEYESDYTFPEWPSLARPNYQDRIAGTYALGIRITNNGLEYEVTKAGTTVAYNIAFNTTIGDITNDGTVEWTRVANKNPAWLSELNRVRINTYNAVGFIRDSNPYDLCVSNEWPIAMNDVYGQPIAVDYSSHKFLKFYHADTGNAESITIQQNGGNMPIIGRASITESSVTFGKITLSGSRPYYQLVSSTENMGSEIEVFITIPEGTDQTVTGDFVFEFAARMGGDFVDDFGYAPKFDPNAIITDSPLSLVTFDTSNWPFGDFTTELKGYGLSENNYPPRFQGGSVGAYWNNLDRIVVGRCTVNQTVAAGTYSIKATISQPAADSIAWVDEGAPYYSPVCHTAPRIRCDLNHCIFYTTGEPFFEMSIAPTSSDVNGIHDSEKIKMLELGEYPPLMMIHDSNGDKKAPAIVGGASMTTSVAGLWTGKTTMVLGLNAATPEIMPWNLLRTKYGSTSNAIVNPMLLQDLAPYNIIAQISNSYMDLATYEYIHGGYGGNHGKVVVELQPEPPTYINGRYYSKGFTVIDSNGNFQRALNFGISSIVVWKTELDEITIAGDVQWKCFPIPSTGRIIPAIHRPVSVPKYPIYWEGDIPQATTWAANTEYNVGDLVIDANGNTQKITQAGTTGATAPTWNTDLDEETTDGGAKWVLTVKISHLLPPTATSGLTIWGAWNQWRRNNYTGGHDVGWQEDNLAYGWWIYSVTFNRIMGNVKNGIPFPTEPHVPTQEIPVTIGCMRDGVFESFGTYQTGTTNKVLWPVFTSDALVYKCTERIDIQAVAIATTGTHGVNTTGDYPSKAEGYPVAASFVTDPAALIYLLA